MHSNADGLAHEQIQMQLQVHLDPSLQVVCRDTQGDIESLWPEEAVAVSDAIPRRQREFAAGRAAAREALRRLNGPKGPVSSNLDRSPCWPDGFVGSIAHTSAICIAVVGRRMSWASIGIDIEPDKDIDESLWSIICTPHEIGRIQEMPKSKQAHFASRVFVAKEAFYKWHYPQWKKILDFQEVALVWDHDWHEFKASTHASDHGNTSCDCSGQLLAIGSHLIAYCMTPSQNSKLR